MYEQHGEYQRVSFTPYVTSRVGRNEYGEWDCVPVYKTFISRGEIVPSNIREPEPVETGHDEFGEFLDF